jgi:hypothetical protein
VISWGFIQQNRWFFYARYVLKMFDIYIYLYLYNGIVAAPDRNSDVICNCVNYGSDVVGSYLELQ